MCLCTDGLRGSSDTAQANQGEGLGVLHFTGRKASFEAQTQGPRGKTEAAPDSVSLSPAQLASSSQNEAELRKRVPGESDCVYPHSPHV